VAIVLTNNLTPIHTFDSATGLSVINASGLTTYSGFQREGSNCIGEQASQETVYIYATIASADFSNRTILGPWMRSGNPDVEANGGFEIFLGDGTNQVGYRVGGSDNYGIFFGGWSLFKLDGASLPVLFTTVTGSEANLSFSTITEVGGGLSYITKAVGSSDNIFIDSANWVANGTPGLIVGGGTTGDRGTFAEIVTEDESTSNAYGVIRRLLSGSKAYELNYGIDIGDSGTGSSFFEDSGFQLFLFGGIMSAGNIDINFLANSTGTNLLSLDDFVVVNTGTVSSWDLSNTNSDTMSVTNGQFTDCGTFLFPVAGGTLRQCTNTTFNNCGQVTPNTVTFSNNTFNGSTNADGAMLLPSSTSNMSGLDFNSDGSGHAIYITTPGTYTFTNFTYTGYGANDTTDAVVYNNSGGAVTINVSGGDTPTVRNGVDSTTDVIAGTVSVTVRTVAADGSTVANVVVHVEATGAGPFPDGESISIVRSGSTATVTHTAHELSTNDKVVIRNAAEQEYNGVFVITVTGANTYTYTVPGSPATPATGSPDSTFVILNGTTDGGGEITMSRVFPSNQPVKGVARRSSTSPFYKSAPITGTVSSSQGLTQAAVMIVDE
jgi:hypothetical protein